MATWAKGVNFKNSNNTKNIGGIGVYGTNTTTEKLYIGLGEEPWNNVGLQLTNNEINFKGNKIYHTGDKPSLSDIGAAAASHSHSVLTGINDTRSTEYSPGTARSDFKVTFQESGTNGVNDGGNFYSLVHLPRWANSTGGYGSQIALTDNENIWYRKGASDTAWTGWKRIWHSGNFDPNTKFQSGGTYGTLYLTDWFRAKGNTGLYFQDYGGGWYMTDSTWVRSYAGKNIYTDGIMNAKNGFQWNGQSLDSRYAAATHSHSYLPLSGGTLTGAVTFANNTYNIFGDDVALGDCNQAGKIGIKGLNGETGIYFYPQSGNVPQTISINGAGTLTISGTTKGNFNGSLTGNASTATTLQTARSITIGSTSKSFNGSNNVSWSHNEMSVPKTHVHYTFGGNQNAITTAQFVSLLVNAGAFQQNYWISRGSWSYAQNQYITDTGCGNIHLAGCTIEVIGSTSLYTIRIHTPTTSSSGVSNGDFIYINNGTDYSPGWRRIYNNKYKPSLTDIGAASASHNHDSSYVRQVNANGYYGITSNGNTSEWVRTTLNGLIPYQSGGASSLGTSSWPFNDIYANNIYDNGILLENKFAAASHGNHVPATQAANNAIFLRNDNTWQTIDAWNVNGVRGTQMFEGGNDMNTYNPTRTWSARTFATTSNRPADYCTVFNVGGNASSNFQLAHSYANTSAFYVRGRHDTSGNYTPWARVYTTQYKPSASDIGAAASNHNHDGSYLKSTGGTVSGDILSTGMFTTRAGSADASLRFLNNVASIRYGGTGAGSSNGFNIVGSGDVVKFRVDENGELYARGSQRVYHTGYKPSYSDVGAAAASHTHSNYAPTSHNHTSLTGVNSIAFASHETDAVSVGVLVDGTKSYMDFNLADDFDDMWRWRFKASGASIFNAMTLQALSGTTSRLTVAGEVAATTFSGNATTTTKLQTPRAIKIGNTSKNFDGSGNVTWTLNEIGASASNHTHSNYLPTSGGTLSGAIKFSTATIGASPNSNTLQVSGTNDSGMGGIKLGAGGCRIYGKKDAAILFVEGGIFTNDTLQTSDAVIPGAYKNNNSDATNGWARIVRGCTDNVGSVKVQVGGTNTTASFEVVNPSWSTAWFSCGNTGIRSNSYSNFSDERLKTNIEETKKISNKINKIGVYTYNYLSDFDTDISTCSGEARLCENMPEKRWGVIAQEVEELFPELITESKTLIDGENKVVKSVDVYGLTVLTLEFAKEIYKENQSLKEEIKLMKEKLGL